VPGDAAAQFLTIAKRYGLAGTRAGRFVAQIELCPGDGVVKPTGTCVSPSHHTWWPYGDADRIGTFREVVNEDEFFEDVKEAFDESKDRKVRVIAGRTSPGAPADLLGLAARFRRPGLLEEILRDHDASR
jgi:hypothetical protein